MSNNILFKILGSGLLVLFLSSLSAQSIAKFRSTFIDFKVTQNDGTYSDWSGDKESNVLIMHDFDNSRITIYSSTRQVLDVFMSLPPEELNDRKRFAWKAINQEGEEVLITVDAFNESSTVMYYFAYEAVIVNYTGAFLN